MSWAGRQPGNASHPTGFRRGVSASRGGHCQTHAHLKGWSNPPHPLPVEDPVALLGALPLRIPRGLDSHPRRSPVVGGSHASSTISSTIMVKPWHRWPKGLREHILARDSRWCRKLGAWVPHCQIRGPGCTHRATHVDHVVSPLEGGSWFDPPNLRAACASCNKRKGSRRDPYPTNPQRF